MKTDLEKGILIAFEGSDFVGKSTAVRRLNFILEDLNYSVVATFEPSDGIYGKQIRSDFFKELPSPEQQLDLFLKDRKDHVERIIAPALAEKKIVLEDRYFLSTAAYQGAAGFDPKWIIALNESFAPIPDLWVIIDLDPEKALQRAVSRGTAPNAFEKLEFLKKVAEFYKNYRGVNVAHIDGELGVEQMTHEIAKAIYLGPLRKYI